VPSTAAQAEGDGDVGQWSCERARPRFRWCWSKRTACLIVREVAASLGV